MSPWFQRPGWRPWRSAAPSARAKAPRTNPTLRNFFFSSRRSHSVEVSEAPSENRNKNPQQSSASPRLGRQRNALLVHCQEANSQSTKANHGQKPEDKSLLSVSNSSSPIRERQTPSGRLFSWEL